MFVVLLKFSTKKASAGKLMAEHNAWIQKGVDDGVFLAVGTLQPKHGGAVIVHNIDRADLNARINADPFVREDVVQPEILEITVGKTDARVQFLLP